MNPVARQDKHPPGHTGQHGTMASMFYAIPLDSRPTWRNPPWMTVLLILINMAVF